MTDVTIVLPLPPRALSPNQKPHWRIKAKTVRAYRRDAYAATCAVAGYNQGWPAAVAQATFFFKNNRLRDYANFQAMLKPAYDGIVDAKLIPDDSSEVLSHDKPVFKIDRNDPRVEIHLRRVDPETAAKGDDDA